MDSVTIWQVWFYWKTWRQAFLTTVPLSGSPTCGLCPSLLLSPTSLYLFLSRRDMPVWFGFCQAPSIGLNIPPKAFSKWKQPSLRRPLLGMSLPLSPLLLLRCLRVDQLPWVAEGIISPCSRVFKEDRGAETTNSVKTPGLPTCKGSSIYFGIQRSF